MDATPAELAELKSVFKAECDEHLTALDSLLLKLEQSPENALVLQETFRRVHSIKGAARLVGYVGLESVAHAMETMLAGLARRPSKADRRHHRGAVRGR